MISFRGPEIDAAAICMAVAAHGSDGRRQALHLTPPAVSQQLRALERETGSSLIDRSGGR